MLMLKNNYVRVSFIQILFIYKWHARNFNVSFFTYNVTI